MSPRHDDASPDAPRNGTVRIVHIEDCADDAELVSLELLAAGFALQCLRVDDERQLLAALSDFVPDLVLSDLNLPGFSGARALELVRAHAPGIPFVFLSGGIDPDHPALNGPHAPNALLLKDNLADLPPTLRRILSGTGDIVAP